MKKYRIPTLLSVLIALSAGMLNAQTTINGEVVDSETGAPLSYASIRLKEKAIGVVANSRGEFTLSINTDLEDYTLIVSYIGYTNLEVKLTEFVNRSSKTIKLPPLPGQLEEVVIVEEKFDLDKFMKEAASIYQSSSRTTPHIGRAYFQEQATLKFKPVLFAEGIGYSVYLGDVENQAARSNYKFFYEQVSVNQNYKSWNDYIDRLGKTTDHRFGASDNLNNFRTFEMNGPLSSTGKKFKYKLDSVMSFKGQLCLFIKFKGAGQSGWMIIGEESLQVWAIAYNASETIWSNTYNDRVEGSFTCIYDYYEGQHFLSEAYSSYSKGDITHWSSLKVVSQKFDTLALSEKEYWVINSLDRFTIGQSKTSEKSFEPYNFSKKDAAQRSNFKEGFTMVTIDAEKNPDYEELLTKLRAFF